jgi:hypothetical protein
VQRVKKEESISSANSAQDEIQFEQATIREKDREST